MSPSTVQQTLLSVKTNSFIDWCDDFTPEARGTTSPCKAKATKIPKCTLDAKWLEALAREIATTTPKILAHLEAKAKAEKERIIKEGTTVLFEGTQYDLTQSKKKKQKSTILEFELFEPRPQPKATTTPFDNFWKFPCKLNDKTPICKWRDPANQKKAEINPNRFNTGIPTGPRNNLLVVDLDVKDDGVEEFKKYIQAHGKPETLHVITPTGGEHYYFNYAHPDPETHQMIKSFLNNSTKFRGKGIDIRSEGGYIVGPPSVRNGKVYEVTNLTKPSDIPASLVSWLLEGQATKAPKVKAKKATSKELVNHQNNASNVGHDFENIDGYKYDLNDEQIWNILEQLPDEYLTNYTKWLTVTSILKRHGKHAIWSEWCKKGGNYNEAEHERQWNSNQGALDINYLAWVLNQNGGNVEQIPKHKNIIQSINCQPVGNNKSAISKMYPTFRIMKPSGQIKQS